MAEGLPVISAPTCGIPEILPKKCLVSYENYAGYAEAIVRLINNPDLMTKYSMRNINVAKEYKSSILNERRKSFYETLRRCVK